MHFKCWWVDVFEFPFVPLPPSALPPSEIFRRYILLRLLRESRYGAKPLIRKWFDLHENENVNETFLHQDRLSETGSTSYTKGEMHCFFLFFFREPQNPEPFKTSSRNEEGNTQ